MIIVYLLLVYVAQYNLTKYMMGKDSKRFFQEKKDFTEKQTNKKTTMVIL